jgi:pyruvate dehydrogenase E1 component alpha subunit
MESSARADPTPDAAADSDPAVLRHLRRARAISERMVALQREGRIGYHASSIGHEPSIVGAVLAAHASDWIFPSARDWYAALARGLPLATYVHHAFGSARDPSLGHAPPDHVPARRLAVVPPSGIPGAHVLQAVGAAWAAKIKSDGVRVLALFDGEALATGDVHNALNFAGVFRAPVVLVGRSDENAEARATAYGLASASVDGGDVCGVLTTVREALDRIDAGKGATLILVRPAAEDPLACAAPSSVEAEVARELDAAIAEAEAAGPPARGTIFEHVYASDDGGRHA